MNILILSGRVAADPEERETKTSGQRYCKFPLAVKDTWTKRQRDDGKDSAMFVHVVLWGTQGENAMKYVTKGQQITVSGRLSIRHYTNKEGREVYVTECVGTTTEYGASSKQKVGSSSGNDGSNDGYQKTNNNIITEDEIPF